MLFCNYHWVDFMLIYAATIKSALHSLKGFVIKKDCKWVIPSDKVTCTVKSLLVAMSVIGVKGFFLVFGTFIQLIIHEFEITHDRFFSIKCVFVLHTSCSQWYNL